ncbi:divalent-cation tolerance protein CutA [Anaplasma bovis]|uniref:divalent-cation tolerance protein CutA n=1 Tax=Anaplasma bovis TaxID=186733 RepID=UPI002FF046F4
MKIGEQQSFSDASIIYSTFPDYASAYKICNTLLEENLIACANVLQNVSSIYKWEGEIKKSTEHIVILKTTKQLEERAILRVKELHPYTTPAVFSIAISRCAENFLDWIKSQLKGETGH